MLFAGLYLTGQIGKKKNVVPAAAEVQTTETTDATMAQRQQQKQQQKPRL